MLMHLSLGLVGKLSLWLSLGEGTCGGGHKGRHREEGWRREGGWVSENGDYEPTVEFVHVLSVPSLIASLVASPASCARVKNAASKLTCAEL